YHKGAVNPLDGRFPACSQRENYGSDRGTVEGVEGGEVGFPLEIGTALQEADAAIPAKNGVVVAGRMDMLGFGKAMHGAFHEWQQSVWSAAGVKLGFHT